MVDQWTKALWTQRELILERIGVELSEAQKPVVRSDARVRLTLGGERAGKSFVESVDGTSRFPWGSTYWIVGPDYDAPRAEFEYMLEHLEKLDAIRSTKHVRMPKEGSWHLATKTGQTLTTRTSADVRKLASVSVDGILMVEAGSQSFSAYLKCLGRVAQARGWLHVSGTLESSSDWYANIALVWKEDEKAREGDLFSLPTWSNTFEFPGGRNDPEILRLERLYAPVPGYFEEKCGATPAPPLGVIFRSFSFPRNVKESATFRRGVPVYLAIDPGAGGPSAYMVAACQFLPSPYFAEDEDVVDRIDLCHVVDVIYAPGATFEGIKPIVEQKYWYPQVAGGMIDVEDPGERKRWRKFLGIPLAAKKIPILEGERRLHSFLAWREGYGPHLIFSPDVPDLALKEFGQYRSPADTPEDLLRSPPSSSRFRRGPDHLLKGLWYLLVGRYGYVKGGELPSVSVRETWRHKRRALIRVGH